jgi:hypothetical protein
MSELLVVLKITNDKDIEIYIDAWLFKLSYEEVKDFIIALDTPLDYGFITNKLAFFCLDSENFNYNYVGYAYHTEESRFGSFNRWIHRATLQSLSNHLREITKELLTRARRCDADD